ncbi:hypothetical protein [Elizabethkingia miricola]|uniref:hypothetical protein n=1 Tax=Elizabethkingia miricola TaxID=172045 RepID=UPI003891F06A
MKKLLLFVPLISASLLQAQKIEISAAYGTPSIFGVSSSLYDFVGNAITGNSGETSSSNGVLNLNIMMYNRGMKWRYGLEFNMESFDENGTGFTSQSLVSVQPRVDYFWSGADRKLRLYSGVSAGVLFKNAKYIDKTSKAEEKDNLTTFGFNIMPIGLRYGRDFGVFIEPNIGTRGFINAGVSYIF